MIIRANTLFLAPIVFILFCSFVLPINAWDRVKLKNISFPVKDIGSTNALFSVDTPLSLIQPNNDEGVFEEIFSIKDDEEIFEVPDNTPVKDVYVSADQVNINIRLISGSICIYGNSIDRACLGIPEETVNFTTDTDSIVIVEGDIGSEYIPIFVAGDGVENIDLGSAEFGSLEHKYALFVDDGYLYRIAWLDTIYVKQYFDYLRRSINNQKYRFELYENGDCPCTLFDADNEEHYKLENRDSLCPIPGWAGWPTTPNNVPDPSTLIPCPEEPTETEWSEYRDFVNRGIIGYTKLVPGFLSVLKDLFVYKLFTTNTLSNLSDELSSAEIDEFPEIEFEIVETLGIVDRVSRKLLYLTDH